MGPWPAFVDLFASTTLIFLVFFIVIAFRYIGDRGDAVRLRELIYQLQIIQRDRKTFEVREQSPDVLIILEEDVTFPTDSSSVRNMKQGGRDALRDVHALLQTPQFNGLIREIDIVGHADRRGDPFRNWQLSAARAVSVAQFLVDSLHADPCTLLPTGRGAFFPRDTLISLDTIGDSERRRSIHRRDRRIDVLLRPPAARAQSPRVAGCEAIR